MTMRLVHGGQRERITRSELDALDRTLTRLRWEDAYAEVGRRREKWERSWRRRARKTLKGAGLWATAALGAVLAWWGRR